jgi:anti-sigma B factor antagonist
MRLGMSTSATYLPFDRAATAGARISGYVVGRRAVLYLSGEFDIAAAPAMTDAIDEALANGALELWIDLALVTSMDSSALQALARAQRRVRQLDRRLAIICRPGPVLRLLDIAGMRDTLPLYPTRAAAQRSA